EESRVVEAGQQKLIKNSSGALINASVQEFKGDTDLPKKMCRAVVEYRQFNSKAERSEHSFKCFAVDRDAAWKIEKLIKAGVSIPWGRFIIGANGGNIVPDKAIFEWANMQPEPDVDE